MPGIKFKAQQLLPVLQSAMSGYARPKDIKRLAKTLARSDDPLGLLDQFETKYLDFRSRKAAMGSMEGLLHFKGLRAKGNKQTRKLARLAAVRLKCAGVSILPEEVKQLAVDLTRLDRDSREESANSFVDKKMPQDPSGTSVSEVSPFEGAVFLAPFGGIDSDSGRNGELLPGVPYVLQPIKPGSIIEATHITPDGGRETIEIPFDPRKTMSEHLLSEFVYGNESIYVDIDNLVEGPEIASVVEIGIKGKPAKVYFPRDKHHEKKMEGFYDGFRVNPRSREVLSHPGQPPSMELYLSGELEPTAVRRAQVGGRQVFVLQQSNSRTCGPACLNMALLQRDVPPEGIRETVGYLRATRGVLITDLAREAVGADPEGFELLSLGMYPEFSLANLLDDSQVGGVIINFNGHFANVVGRVPDGRWAVVDPMQGTLALQDEIPLDTAGVQVLVYYSKAG